MIHILVRVCCALALVLITGLVVPTGAAAGENDASNNTSPSTDLQWVTTGSNVTQIGTGLRVIRREWYVQAGIGGLSAFDNRENAFFVELNLGHRFPLLSWLRLGVDVGYRHVMPDGSDNPDIDTDKFFTLEGRLMLEAVLGRKMSLFVGGGSTNIYQGYSLGSDTVHKGSIFWGVGLL